jgi:inosine-uridine nucleoside N-ribohydrolase
MFDVVAAAYAVDPKVCPTTPLHVEVDDAGFTRVQPGTPNVQACIEPRQEAFFKLLISRLLNQRLVGEHACIAPTRH